jgi:hypothetical protein
MAGKGRSSISSGVHSRGAIRAERAPRVDEARSNIEEKELSIEALSFIHTVSRASH